MSALPPSQPRGNNMDGRPMTSGPEPTAGKNGISHGGGHTSQGAPYRKPGNSTAPTANENHRLGGTLSTRTCGQGNDCNMK